MDKKYSKDEIFKEICKILEEEFEIDKSKLKLDADLFQDLELDSIDAVDMAVDMLYAKLLSDPKTITPAATPAIDIKDIGNDHIEVEFTLVASPKV